MKKALLTIVIMSLVAANTNAGSLQDRLAAMIGIEPSPQLESLEPQAADSALTFWLMGTPTELDNPDAEFSARLGWATDGIELGCQFDAIGIHGENDETFGIYALLHLEGDITSVIGRAYTGYAASIISENRSYGPIAGTIFSDFMVLEYRYRSFSGDSPLSNTHDEHQVYAGLRLLF